MASYYIPAAPCDISIEVKRSHFLGFAQHTPSIESAKAFIASLQKSYPDARHHCYGFMAGAPWESQQYGFSDDNEPSGTAGMPIFSHLKHNNIGQVTLVVVRYFGGTKLGTGGLVRAYSDAAKKTLEALALTHFIEKQKIIYQCGFAQEAQVRKVVIASGGSIDDCCYTDRVTLTAQIPKEKTLELPYSVTVLDSTI